MYKNRNIHIKTGNIYYGWINLAVLWVCYLSLVGTITYNFGVVVVPMTMDLGISMTIATAFYSASTLIQALISPMMGKFIEARGVRNTMMLGTAAFTVGCMLLGVTKSLPIYVLAWIPFVAVGQRFGSMSPAYISVAHWFHRKRGLATALLLSSGGLAGFIFMPMMTGIAERFSWRYTWFAAAAFSAVSFLLVATLLKNKPEDVGQHVDGDTNPTDTDKRPEKGNGFKTREKWLLGEATRTAQFYQICFLQISVSFLQIAISSQALNYMTLSGIPTSIAASAIGFFSVTSIAGRLLVGIFSDRAGAKKVMVAASVFALFGVVCLATVRSSLMAYVFALSTGIGFGMFMVGPPTMLADYFGTADYVKINSRFSLISGVVAAFTAVIVGAIYDYTGGYTAVWITVLAIILLNGLSMVLLRQPQKIKKNEV